MSKRLGPAPGHNRPSALERAPAPKVRSDKRQPEHESSARNTKGLVGANLLTLVFFGRGGGIRTRDPLHPMQVRYQAALRPDKN